jgi:hypothetical protein
VRGSLQSKSLAAEGICDSSQKPAAPQTARVEGRQKSCHYTARAVLEGSEEAKGVGITGFYVKP